MDELVNKNMALFWGAVKTQWEENRKVVIGCSAAALGVSTAFFMLRNVRNSGPHHTTSYMLTGIGAPRVKTGEPKVSNDETLCKLKEAMKDYIVSGHGIGTQLSLFVDNKEVINFWTADSRRQPDYDQSAIHPLFSSTKNITALLMAVAVNNGWIESYDDNITKYWPKFPTKCQSFMVTTDSKGNKKMNFKDEAPRQLKIADALRHEAGLDSYWDGSKCFLGKTGLDDIRDIIEKQKLTYRRWPADVDFPVSDYCYHAFNRGFILNEIFRRVEPQKRSMNEFFVQEIKPILSKNDPDFRMYLKGKPASDPKGVYHIANSNPIWTVYHWLIPLLTNITFHLPKKIFYEKYLTDVQYSNFPVMSKLMLDTTRLPPEVEADTYSPEFDELLSDTAKTSRFFEHERDVKMEWMSVTGLSNAHSLAKLMSFILYSKEMNMEKTMSKIVDKPKLQHMAMVNGVVEFTQGGFHRMEIYGIEWFIWGGTGGSSYYFAPKYRACFGHCVSAFSRFDIGFPCDSQRNCIGDTPRQKVILWHLAKYLKSL